MTSEPKTPTLLIVGSTAFTATSLIQTVLETTRWNVIGVSRSAEDKSLFLPHLAHPEAARRYAFHQLDVNADMDAICRLSDVARPDYVVNMAAQGEVRSSWEWPDRWFETNCMAVVRLTEHLRSQDYLKRYMAVSTPEVYGVTGDGIKENHTYVPSTPYAASKLAGDLHLLTYFKKYDFPVVFTRAANVYGPHQQLYRIIPRTVISLKLGQPMTLHGRGETLRAFIHVRDVADLTIRALEQGTPGEVYHVAPSDGVRSIGGVVRLICERMEFDFDQCVQLSDENYGQDACYSLDASKAHTQLDWKPHTPFEKGIQEVIDWVENNWEAIKHSPLEHVHRP